MHRVLYLSLKKAASLLLTVLFLLTIIFTTFMVIPGDPAYAFTKGLSPDLTNDVVNEFRLDESLFVQYIDYIRDSLIGDFRISTSSLPGAEIEDMISSRVSATVLLFTMTLAVSILAALALEYLASSLRSKIMPWTTHALAVMTFSAPAVWHSLWLLNLTCNAGLDPPLRGNGFDAIRNDGILGLLTVLSHLALPLTAAFLATFGLFVLMFRWANRRRLARGALDSEKGFRKWSVSVLHELTGMRPFVYFMVAWTFCVILIVDSVYGYMGLGTLMGWSFGIRDYPLMMALLFVSSLFVLVAGIVVNTAFNLASRRDLDVAMSDWVQRDEAFEDNTMAKEEKAVQPRQWIVAIAGLSVRNWAFMGAVIVLLAVAASAALAPTLVTEPWNLWYLEPDAYVYSETLYGARPAIVIAAALVVGAVSIGIAVGMASFYFPSADAFPKILKDLFDFVLTALARTYVIIPITLIGIAWMLTAQTHLSTIPLLLVALYSWAWIMTCRPIRSMARTAGPRVRFGRALPGILAESLSIAKFVVPIAFLIEMLLSSNYLNFGPGSRADFTWYNLFEQIYALGGFLYGDWYLVYIPIAAIVLVCASLFVVLDRTEHILRTSQVYPERRLAVVDEEATPGS